VTYLEELEDVIVKIHGCEAISTETVEVEETHQGRTVWQGEVEVFELIGHPRANRCYAWGLPDEWGALQIVTVLEISPVNSALMAVRVALASGARGTGW
jgi:ethanolamine utilization microcompartment shell protein EutS